MASSFLWTGVGIANFKPSENMPRDKREIPSIYWLQTKKNRFETKKREIPFIFTIVKWKEIDVYFVVDLPAHFYSFVNGYFFMFTEAPAGLVQMSEKKF